MVDIANLTKEALKDIKLIIFDVDGVLVPRGTIIKQEGETTTLHTKTIAVKLISTIEQLKRSGFYLNINSGRGLYMLQEMFRSILPFVSLTYENGSATWFQGEIIQHVNSFKYLIEIYPILKKVNHEDIKGFEPKEFIITIHCKEQIQEIEDIVASFPDLYTKWNGEAYDIGVKKIQTKGVGVKAFIKHLGIKKENVLAIGDNFNDKELLDEAGIAVSADKTRLKGDYYIPLMGAKLPAEVLMEQILRVIK